MPAHAYFISLIEPSLVNDTEVACQIERIVLCGVRGRSLSLPHSQLFIALPLFHCLLQRYD